MAVKNSSRRRKQLRHRLKQVEQLARGRFASVANMAVRSVGHSNVHTCSRS